MLVLLLRGLHILLLERREETVQRPLGTFRRCLGLGLGAGRCFHGGGCGGGGGGRSVAVDGGVGSWEWESGGGGWRAVEMREQKKRGELCSQGPLLFFHLFFFITSTTLL